MNWNGLLFGILFQLFIKKRIGINIQILLYFLQNLMLFDKIKLTYLMANKNITEKKWDFRSALLVSNLIALINSYQNG